MTQRQKKTVGEHLAKAIETLRPASLAPHLEAELLLAHATHRSRAYLLAHPEEKVYLGQQDTFGYLVRQRAHEVPMAYLIGECEFYELRFCLDRHVLIPRPETEHLVEAAIAWAKGRPNSHIIDVGTGSGAIAIALAVHLPDARVTALDTSTKALGIAEMNAGNHKVDKRIVFDDDDLCFRSGEPADLIVANLPYVPSALLNRVSPHEPRKALDGGEDGLACIEALLMDAPKHMKDQSLLLVEIGFGQADAVCVLARDAFPDADIGIIDDYAGHPRVLRVENVENVENV